jgi:hypothetical protein
MTVKKNPNADSPGDFVGRGGLGAGGGRTYTGSTGGKSIITGKKKSSVSKKTKDKLKGEKKKQKEKEDKFRKAYIESRLTYKLGKKESKALKKVLDRKDKEWDELSKLEEKKFK